MTISLGLGTAQFGIPYGVTNASGIPSEAELLSILESAQTDQIKVLDTAPGYGNAETRLGNSGRLGKFNVVTKLSSLKGVLASSVKKTIDQSIRSSREKLKAESLYGVLLHDANDIFSETASEAVEALKHLRAEGQVEKVGVSIYTAADIDKTLQIFTPDIVQVPVNAFDQRLIKSGALKRLQTKGVEIHLRSIFLQGLLLSKPAQLPEHLTAFESRIDAWHAYWAKTGVSSLVGALAFIRALPISAVALVGVAKANELNQIASAWERSAHGNFDFSQFDCDESGLIDPRTWK